MSEIVHCKKEPYDVMIDRRTPYGNPFTMKNKSDEERTRVIEEFEKWFLDKMERGDNLMYKVLANLSGKTLGCWCKPKPCHGDIIVEWLNNYKEESNELS